MSDAEDNLVTVKTYTLQIYADTDRVHLENAGIPAFVADANTVMADYFLGNALGYIKLQVPSSRVDDAMTVLNRHRTERHAFSGDPPLDITVRCLACNAVMAEEEERCGKCGWSFTDGAETDEIA